VTALKEFFRKKGIYIAIAAIVIALAAAVSVSLSGGHADLGAQLSEPFWRPVRSAMTSFVSSLEKIYNYMYRYDEMEAENAQLKEKVAQLEEEYRTYTEISAENERLKALLNFTQGRGDENFKTLPASVIAWTASNYASSFTANRGSGAGVKTGDAVITETGYLVGQVTEVSATSSTVTTILDTTMSVGALVYENGRTGVAEGGFELLKQGNVKLSYLGDNADIVIGDTVVTSGKGGTYPSGLVIGHITGLNPSTSGLDSYAVVAPAAEISGIANVYIVTDFTPAG